MAIDWRLTFDEQSAHEENNRRTVADLSEFDHVTHFVDFAREDEYDKAEPQPSAQAARAEADLESSTVISSAFREIGKDWKTRRHTIALDIDHRVRVVPSTTSGHSHLYIDVPLEWDDYKRLLDLLGELGVVEPGYVAASTRRRATHLRLPWVKKVPTTCPHSDIVDGHLADCLDVARHDGDHILTLTPPLTVPVAIDVEVPF